MKSLRELVAGHTHPLSLTHSGEGEHAILSRTLFEGPRPTSCRLDDAFHLLIRSVQININSIYEF